MALKWLSGALFKYFTVETSIFNDSTEIGAIQWYLMFVHLVYYVQYSAPYSWRWFQVIHIQFFEDPWNHLMHSWRAIVSLALFIPGLQQNGGHLVVGFCWFCYFVCFFEFNPFSIFLANYICLFHHGKWHLLVWMVL